MKLRGLKSLRNLRGLRDWDSRMVTGSMTVEMSFLMPMILFLIMSCIFAVFYFHDKNILSAAAYETAVVGSTKMREKGETDAAKLQTLFQDRIENKCILFAGSQAQITVGEEEICVKASAAKGRFKVSVEQRAAVTNPEEFIRDYRRIKELGNGAQNND